MTEATERIAIISGGLGDIGRACALELARGGADIAVGDLQENEHLDTLRTEVERLGRRFRFDHVDVVQADGVRAWTAAVEQELGPPNLIIANAAIVETADFSQLTPEVWQRHLDVNLTGCFYLAHTTAERLVALGKPGRIVLLGSWAGHTPLAHIPAYCVAKAALRMLGQCLALHYAQPGILVNEVAPGFVDAGLTGQLFQQNPALRAEAQAMVPTGCLLQSEDVAFHVGQLCDPRAGHMTGSTLLCDGGLSLVSVMGKGDQEPTSNTK